MKPEKREGDITVRCPMCSAEIYQRLKNTDPRGTAVVLLACARCTKKRATLQDCTFLDANGRELGSGDFEGLKGPR